MYALDEEKIKNAKATQILIAINVVCFLIFNPYYSENLLFLVSQYNLAVWNGEIWRLITSTFVHADIMHILYNMIGLLLFGATIENFIGKKATIFAYLISGLVGSIFSLLLNSVNTISLGASGAIYGLMGISFMLLYRDNKFIFVYGLIYIVISLMNSFAPGIGTWAHVFGLISGIIIGYYYLKKQQKQQVYSQTRYY